MQDIEGSASTTFFSHSSLHALSCVFRLVYFACTHVLSFSHLYHIRSLMLEKSYESTIHSLSLTIQLPLEKAKRRTEKEENKAPQILRQPASAPCCFFTKQHHKKRKNKHWKPPPPRSLRKPCCNAPSRTVSKQYYIRRNRQNDASTTKQYNTTLHLTLQINGTGRL
jgi:hypothetical protein